MQVLSLTAPSKGMAEIALNPRWNRYCHSAFEKRLRFFTTAA
jgi:hypothetical protein